MMEELITTADVLNAALGDVVPDFAGSISALQRSNEDEVARLLVEIVLSDTPGTRLSYVTNGFVDGRAWVAEQLIKLAERFEIPIDEGITSEDLVGAKKLELLDIYGQFFSSSTRADNDQTTQDHLNTNLRLIFNSPNIRVGLPYIQKARYLLSSPAESPFTKSLLPEPPYPPPECNPTECGDKYPDKPCCCCVPESIISQIALRCSEKVIVSCNKDGSGPGPGLDPKFPAACDLCREVCNGILTGSLPCGNLPQQPWWHYDSTWYDTCHCDCMLHEGPGSQGPCLLTCAKCGKLCASEFEVYPSSLGDCYFSAKARPSQSCCGSPGLIDLMFVIDISGSMGNDITNVKNSIHLIVEKAVNQGTEVRLGITAFGGCGSQQDWQLLSDFTTNVDSFRSTLDAINVCGGREYDMEATAFAVQHSHWVAADRYIVLIGDEPTQVKSGTADSQLTTTVQLCKENQIVVYTVNQTSTHRPQLAEQTGGKNYDLALPFAQILDDLRITAFPAACECLETDYVPILYSTSGDVVNKCVDPNTGLPIIDPRTGLPPERCTAIPIHVCNIGEDCEQACDLEYNLWACGSTITVNPTLVRMVCCSEVGYGCKCHPPQPEGQCCGPTDDCDPVCDPVSGFPLYASVEEAQEATWCKCFDKASELIPNTCTHCCCPDSSLPVGHRWYPCSLLESILPGDPLYGQAQELLRQQQCCDTPPSQENDCCHLCILVSDGSGSSLRYCKEEMDLAVASAFANCRRADVPDFECADERLNDVDCIVANIDAADPCAEPRAGQGSVYHPSTTVLNNGIGLVAYEVHEDEQPYSNIRVEQFKTSVLAKILPNRTFNFGRLQNRNSWSSNISVNNKRTAKLYYYCDLPSQLINDDLGSGGTLPSDIVWTYTPVYKWDRYVWSTAEWSIYRRYGNWSWRILGYFCPNETVDLLLPSYASSAHQYVKVFFRLYQHAPTSCAATVSISNGTTISVEQPSLSNGASVIGIFRHSGSTCRITFGATCTGDTTCELITNTGAPTQYWGPYRASQGGYGIDDVKVYFGTSASAPPPPTVDESLTDSITFVSGPLRGLCFPLAADPTSRSPLGVDENGNYILFSVPDGLELTSPFPSSDDVYNVEWFLQNKDDVGLIGDTNNIAPGTAFTGAVVSERMKAISHKHNGLPIPLAHPSLTCAKNYMSAQENSHYSYLAYQAMEEGKWNIYLRQLRLSEYDKESQIQNVDPVDLVDVAGLGVENLVYRIVCSHDAVSKPGDDYLASRTIVAEVMLTDGREVLTAYSTGNWGQLCGDYPAEAFTKRKVFVRIKHNAVSDRLPDLFDMDQIFSPWQVGSEYACGFGSTNDEIFGCIVDPASVPLGVYDVPHEVGTVFIKSSSYELEWYQSIAVNGWYVMAGDSLSQLQEYKGFDICEPILIDSGTEHRMKPVVVVDYNNDVYVIYEKVISGTPQIAIAGTATPGSSLPAGTITAKNLDDSLDYFLMPSSFVFRSVITSAGTNQSPAAYVDRNNDVHVVWQSNRDNNWEIYYANASSNFDNTRITKSNGKSLRPRIDGDNDGNLYVTWSDSRFGNYEIMMAYRLGTRILPYSQQDPYWAGARNDYSHYEDSVLITLSNPTNEPLSFEDIRVVFCYDRNLSQPAFTVGYKECPFAFSLSDAQIVTIEANGVLPCVLDLTPEISVALNGSTVAIPLSEVFRKNNTYFIRVYGVKTDDSLFYFERQMSTVSCYSCTRTLEPFESTSCTYLLQYTHSGASNISADFDVVFRTSESSAVPKLTLSTNKPTSAYFSTPSGSPISDIRTPSGLTLVPNSPFSLLVTPPISRHSQINTSLACGVDYVVELYLKQGASKTLISTDVWKCDCNSGRWEETPVNDISQLSRWYCSGGGYSDVRLTETRSNNFNPVIKMKSNYHGMVLYESDRLSSRIADPKQRFNEVFASVFNFLPDDASFATGSQAIVPPKTGSIARMDIRLNVPSKQEFIAGNNLDFSLDQYDNMFIAVEEPGSPALSTGGGTPDMDAFKRQRFIKVYRLDLDPLSFETAFTQDVGGQSGENPPSEEDDCIERITCYPTEEDPSLASIVKQIRVEQSAVRYHVTRNGRQSPVVKNCQVKFIVIGTPETVAVRLRNSSTDEWSVWFSFASEISAHTIEVPWTLSKGNGIKTVFFQFAAYSGLAAGVKYELLADYDEFPYTLYLYKPVPGLAAVTSAELTDSTIFSEANRTKLFNAFPVASLETVDISGSQPNYSFVFIEIVPDAPVTSDLTFDFIQQGPDDYYNQPTLRVGNAYRGAIRIEREDLINHRDGMAVIVPHFPADCLLSNEAPVVGPATTVTSYVIPPAGTHVQYNTMLTPTTTTSQDSPDAAVRALEDPWKEERDQYGHIQHRVVIRPDDDPHFVFGDPDYRLKTEND
jgi:hypothetical protein